MQQTLVQNNRDTDTTRSSITTLLHPFEIAEFSQY